MQATYDVWQAREKADSIDVSPHRMPLDSYEAILQRGE
jgi:hypothetical protein